MAVGQSAYSKFRLKSFGHKKNRSNLQIEPRVYYGFTMSHHTELEPFNAHMPAFELSIIKDTYGKKEWERVHNYPIIGISFFYSSLAKNPAVGQSFAVYPFITFPVLRKDRNFFGLKLGIGLSYLTKTFDPIENYKNIAIGSHLNVAINLMAEYRLKLNKTTEFSAGLNLIHFSNGSMATPNYGLNMPMMSVGVSKRLAKENKKIASRRAQIPVFSYKPNKILIFNILGGYASKNMGNVFGERFDVYTTSFSALKYFNEISAFGLSFDFSWDGSHKALLEKEGVYDPTFNNVIKSGIAPTYEMKVDRLLLGVALGMYWGGKEKSDGDIYEQLTIKYIVYDGVFANVTLRAHAARAAFVSFGIGYRLQYDFGKKDEK
ncbi:MAG: acyloxyacyl hydrolase [Bacteroidales bacterium]|nr:acyloxyacyl hydrolase [Bacteroidales bacterium]